MLERAQPLTSLSSFRAIALGLLLPAVLGACVLRDTPSDSAPFASPAEANASAGANETGLPRATRKLSIYPEIEDSPHDFETTPAPHWTALFQRHEGWTGADGIYSLSLDGRQAPGRSDGARTLFTFADTIIGRVQEATLAREPGWKMVHLSMALLSKGRPDPGEIEFSWPGSRADWPLFRLQVPPLEGMRFWLQDGLVLDDTYHSLAMATEALDAAYPWWARGAALISAPIGPDGPIWSRTRQRLGVYEVRDEEDALVFFGAAILENTKRAGWRDPDGHLYIYGRYERAMRPYNPWRLRVELVVARVKPDRFEDFASWEFWNGHAWTPELGEATPMGLGGPELSVTPIECGVLTGKYLLVSKQVRSDLYYRVGDTPWGPFSAPYRFHRSAEEREYGYPTFTYNAKAHPHLSEPGRLLVSYNVHNLEALAENGDIYRPHFVWLEYAEPSECAANRQSAARAARAALSSKRMAAPAPSR